MCCKVDKVQMPNIPCATASKYFGCFLLAISIKHWSQSQCIWETWRAGLMKAHLSFSRMGLRPHPPPVSKRKRPEWWWRLGIIPTAVCCSKGSRSSGGQCCWDSATPGKKAWSSLTSVGKRGRGHAFLFAACLLPLPSTNEVAVPWAQSQDYSQDLQEFLDGQRKMYRHINFLRWFNLYLSIWFVGFGW